MNDLNTYRITMYGGGSETVIGTIPKHIAKYWSTKFEDKLWEHLHHYLDAFGNKEDFLEEHYIPEMYQIEQDYWHDIDDVMHTNGISVYDVKNCTIEMEKNEDWVEVATLCFDSFNKKSNKYFNLNYPQFPDIHYNNQVLFTAWTTEKMCCLYEDIHTNLSVKNLIAKMKFNVDVTKNDRIITSMSIGNNIYEHNGGEGFTKCLDMELDFYPTAYRFAYGNNFLIA